MKNFIIGAILLALSSNTLAKELTRDGKVLVYPFGPLLCIAPTQLNHSFDPNSPLAESFRRLQDQKQKQYAECKKQKIKYEKDKEKYDKEMKWRNEAIAKAEKYFYAYRPNYKATLECAEEAALAGNKKAIELMILASRDKKSEIVRQIKENGANEENSLEYAKYTEALYIWNRVYMENYVGKNLTSRSGKSWEGFLEVTKSQEQILKDLKMLEGADARIEAICKRINEASK